MTYVFESIDKIGSRKRIIYGCLRNALRYALRAKRLPRLRRDANDLRMK